MRDAILALVISSVLGMSAEVGAQERWSHGNPLDQGNDACPAAVIPMAPYYVEGTTVGMANDFTASCGGSANSPDVIYEYTPAQTDHYSVSLCGTTWDTVLYIREGGACPGDSEIVCNDDYCGLASTVYATLQAGHTYFIIVDGFGGGYSGPYRMFVHPHPSCDFGSFHNLPAETSEYPIDSVFYEHDPNGGCGSDTLPEQPYFGIDYLVGRSFNYRDDTDSLRADEDWYSFGMTEPDTVKVVLRAYFPIHLEMLKLVHGCDSIDTLGELNLTTCSADSIVYPCAAPGDYALRVTCAADTEMLIPQFYKLTLSRWNVPCECDTCECDSVTDLTAFLSPHDQRVWLHWSADSSGEVFTIYSTEYENDSYPGGYWHARDVFTSEAPGLQSWIDPDTAAIYQNYVVVRYCP